HGEEGIEHQFLRYHAEGPTRGAIPRAHVVTHHARGPPVGAYQAGENADERGLAGAVRAEQAGEFSLRYLEVDTGERLQIAEALLNVAEFDRGVHAVVRERGKNSALSRQEQLGDSVELCEILHRSGQIGKPQPLLASPG